MTVSLSVAEGYALWAPSYDSEANLLIALDRKYEWLRAQAVLMAPARERALDLACGTGRHLRFLEQHFRSVVGVDLSDAMLERAIHARTKASTLLLQGAIQDAILSQSGVSPFDFVNCSLAMMHFSDLDGFFGRISSHLTAGGILYLTDAAEEILQNGSTPNFDLGEQNHRVDFSIHSRASVFKAMLGAGLVPQDVRTISVDSDLIQSTVKFGKYSGKGCLTCITAKKGGA